MGTNRLFMPLLAELDGLGNGFAIDMSRLMALTTAHPPLSRSRGTSAWQAAPWLQSNCWCTALSAGTCLAPKALAHGKPGASPQDVGPIVDERW